MKISRYKVPIILFIIISILNAVIFIYRDIIIPTVISQDISPLVPFSGATEILLIFIVIWPIMASLGGVIGTFLSPVFIWLHKKTLGRNMIYGIEEVHKSEKYQRTFRGFFPSLMAINFSMILSDYVVIQNFLISPSYMGMGVFSQLITFVFGITFTIFVAFLLFSSLWAVSDAGIVFSNKKVVENKEKERPIIATSVGDVYNYIFKGFAGIGVCIAYIELATKFLTNIFAYIDLPPYVYFVNTYLFLGYFIILPLISIPASIVVDIQRNWRVKYVRDFAAKIGIVDKVEIELKKIDK